MTGKGSEGLRPSVSLWAQHEDLPLNSRLPGLNEIKLLSHPASAYEPFAGFYPLLAAKRGRLLGLE